MAQAAQGKAVKFEGIVPIFLVNDVVKSAEWYRDVLGFTLYGHWGDPPCFSIVGRDGVEIFLKGPECPGQTLTLRSNRSQVDGWDAFIRVSDADAAYNEFRSRGAKILRPPQDMVYHQREFDVEDVNGYTLCFAHETKD